jgi:hypothetical protein
VCVCVCVCVCSHQHAGIDGSVPGSAECVCGARQLHRGRVLRTEQPGHEHRRAPQLRVQLQGVYSCVFVGVEHIRWMNLCVCVQISNNLQIALFTGEPSVVFNRLDNEVTMSRTRMGNY